MNAVVDHHAALIYVMVTVSAADGNMTDNELRTIGDIVRHFPIFRGFDEEKLLTVAEECAQVIAASENGLDTVLGLARQALPERLRETAYACAVEVAAADDRINQEELRVLDLIRHGLHIDRLVAAAFVRSAQARHMRA
jgi:tellurite resistance protein